MRSLTSLDDLQISSSWITIGSFDGVHRGHQVLLQRLVSEAHARLSQAIVITFHPHPAVFLRKIDTPFYLSSPEERAALIAAQGVDALVTLPFTQELANQTAETFMTSLVEHLGMRQLLVGPDFALGKGRAGDIPSLQTLGEKLGYQVEILNPVQSTGTNISSTYLRQLISQGQMQPAADLLGRLYSISGEIIHGEGRGSRMGMPTANFQVPADRLLPATGVYATWIWDGVARYESVTNVGFNPTFRTNLARPRIECHLFNTRQDLYGRTLKLEFVRYLRPELRFENADELVAQVKQDIFQAKEVLHHAA